MSYLYDTIYTDYAFSKLANNLANPTLTYSPFNILRVKIGNGDNTLDPEKLSLSKAVYSLNITDVKTTSSSVTFTCEIPEEVEGIEITEIGLFDITTEGTEKLISYSSVQAVKPSDLGFKLVIELNVTLRTVNFYPEKIKIIMNEYEYTTSTILNNLENMFLYIETNLERIIDFNASEVGKNLPQVYYEKERKINEEIIGCTFASRYFALFNKFGSALRNAFFIKYDSYLSYSINDMATDGAYLDIYDNLIEGTGDEIAFDQVATLSVTAKLGILLDDTFPILNKINGSSKYFTFSIKDKQTIEFCIYGNTNTFKYTYTLSEQEVSTCTDSYVNYTFTFSGNLESPACYLYINGTKVEGEYTSVDISDIVDGESYWLRNYLTLDGTTIIGEEIAIDKIVYIRKFLSDTEAKQLSTLLKTRNLDED